MISAARVDRRERALRSLRWPWLSSAFVALAMLVSTVPGGAGAFAFKRAAFEDGEYWRVLTMHLVHPWPRMALFDLGALLLLGLWLELRSRVRLALIGCAAGLLAGFAVVLLRSDLDSYQGSSALVAGLWTGVAVESMTQSGTSRRAGGLLLLLWIGKTTAELTGIWPTAAGGLPAGVESVAEAHLAGGLGGAVAAAALQLRSRPRAHRAG